jgi:hypothetical protein
LKSSISGFLKTWTSLERKDGENGPTRRHHYLTSAYIIVFPFGDLAQSKSVSDNSGNVMKIRFSDVVSEIHSVSEALFIGDTFAGYPKSHFAPRPDHVLLADLLSILNSIFS